MSSAQPAGDSIARIAHALRALKNRDFRLFLSGQMVSLAGTWMQTVAQAWLVYRLTGSSFLLGSVAFCGQLPILLFSPLGGIVADRFDRRRVVLVTQALSMLLAAVLAGLTLSGRVTVGHIFALAACLGAANAFDIPARQAFIVDMVGRKDLINAIALNSSMFNGARIIGPAAAGVLVGAVGEGWCFLANSASYLAVIAGLVMMRTAERSRPAGTASPLENVLEGFRFVRDTKPVRALLLLLGLTSLVGMPYAVLMPIFADRVLHGGARGLGLLMAASGAGALIGALALAVRENTQGMGKLIAAASAVFGACLVLFSLSRSLWLSAALLVPVGFCMMTHMACTNTLIQSMAPDGLRGRVMAFYSMVFMGMAPFGSLLAGATADSLGAPTTVALCGAACILAASGFASVLPSIRPEARRLILAAEMDAAGLAAEPGHVA
ncbi:MAG: MFS transporter [Elusimicrobia bacterium]|nr:MFS transporter [Elusimicrobiota bacterium]